MGTVYEVKLHCKACNRSDTWESTFPLQPGETIVLTHLCSDTSSGPWLVRRRRK